MPYKDKEAEKLCRKRNYHKHKERVAKWCEDNAEQLKYTVRLRHVKSKYNLNPEQYLGKILQQNNKCAICLKEEYIVNKNGDTRPLCVDHDHATGKVRDLLCNKCNAALGHVNDSIELLAKMISYLEKHKD